MRLEWKSMENYMDNHRVCIYINWIGCSWSADLFYKNFIMTIFQKILGSRKFFKRALFEKRTIEKILWYKPFSIEYLEQERNAWQFNGIGSDRIPLNWLVGKFIDAIWKLSDYNPDKLERLKLDLQQLAYRHDKEYILKVWKIYSDLRFTLWVWHLFHWTPIMTRILITWVTLKALVFSKEAQDTYNT